MTKAIEEQARNVRELAEKADPFVKGRLLALADRYDRRLAAGPKVLPPIEMGKTLPVQVAPSER
jgi:hypothetical protein